MTSPEYHKGPLINIRGRLSEEDISLDELLENLSCLPESTNIFVGYTSKINRAVLETSTLSEKAINFLKARFEPEKNPNNIAIKHSFYHVITPKGEGVQHTYKINRHVIRKGVLRGETDESAVLLYLLYE